MDPGVFTRIDRPTPRTLNISPFHTVEAGLGLEGVDTIGPLHIATELTAWHGRSLQAEDHLTRSRLSGALDLGLRWQKQRGWGQHTLGMSVDVRAESIQGHMSDTEPVLWHTPKDRQSIGLLHRQNWWTKSSRGTLEIRQGLDPLSDDVEPIEFAFDTRVGPWSINAWGVGEQAVGSALDIAWTRLGIGVLAVRHEETKHPARPWWGTIHDTDRQMPQTKGLGFGPRARLVVGDLSLRSWSLVGGSDPRVYGHGGQLRYIGRCQCWSTQLGWNQDLESGWSEVVFRVGLGQTSW